MAVLLLILVALSITFLILYKPETSQKDIDDETETERLLKELKQQYPNSEVFLLEGGN